MISEKKKRIVARLSDVLTNEFKMNDIDPGCLEKCANLILRIKETRDNSCQTFNQNYLNETETLTLQRKISEFTSKLNLFQTKQSNLIHFINSSILKNTALLNFTRTEAPACQNLEKAIKDRCESMVKSLDKSLEKSEQERMVLRDLQLLIKIEPAQFMVKNEQFNLIHAFEIALRRVMEQGHQKKIMVKALVDQVETLGMMQTMIGNQSKVEIVLASILSNQLKHTKDNGCVTIMVK